MDNILPELGVAVDPQRYAGRWFCLAASNNIPFQPRNMTDVCAEYTWTGEVMNVRNVGLLQGKSVGWAAVATPLNRLNTRFSLALLRPTAYQAVYRILEVGPDYNWALVTGDERNQMVWLLCRERLQTRAWWDKIIALMEDRFGIDYRKMHNIHHDLAEPLCVDTASTDVAAQPKPTHGMMKRLPDGSYMISV